MFLQPRRTSLGSLLVFVYMLGFGSNSRQGNIYQVHAWICTPVHHFENHKSSVRSRSKFLTVIMMSKPTKKNVSICSCIHTKQHKKNKKEEDEISIIKTKRRQVMESVFATLATISSADTLIASPQPANAAMYDNGPAFEEGTEQVILPSGVKYVDLRVGSGEDVVEGKRVNIQWSLKRSNGYFVDSSAQNDGVPFIFTVGTKWGANDKSGNTAAIEGVDEGIRGMKVGGIRRVLIPPNLAYVQGVEDGKPGPVPIGFGPKQRIRRVMELLKEIPGEFIVVDIKATRVQ
mmetsp:Transcript_15529/g.24175  ORF Transcript_15529/g.24175 Transcript_15529/m.24175 type:complete len:289 (+) Transcript_15529:181-1047(+)